MCEDNIKINLTEVLGCVLAPTGSRQGLMVRFCERDDYILSHASGRNGQINNSELYTKESATWGQFSLDYKYSEIKNA